MHRLQAVAHVGQGAGDDDRHGVADERFFQFILYIQGCQFSDVEFVGHFEASVSVERLFGGNREQGTGNRNS